MNDPPDEHAGGHDAAIADGGARREPNKGPPGSSSTAPGIAGSQPPPGGVQTTSPTERPVPDASTAPAHSPAVENGNSRRAPVAAPSPQAPGGATKKGNPAVDDEGYTTVVSRSKGKKQLHSTRSDSSQSPPANKTPQQTAPTPPRNGLAPGDQLQRPRRARSDHETQRPANSKKTTPSNPKAKPTSSSPARDGQHQALDRNIRRLKSCIQHGETEATILELVAIIQRGARSAQAEAKMTFQRVFDETVDADRADLLQVLRQFFTSTQTTIKDFKDLLRTFKFTATTSAPPSAPRSWADVLISPNLPSDQAASDTPGPPVDMVTAASAPLASAWSCRPRPLTEEEYEVIKSFTAGNSDLLAPPECLKSGTLITSLVLTGLAESRDTHVLVAQVNGAHLNENTSYRGKLRHLSDMSRAIASQNRQFKADVAKIRYDSKANRIYYTMKSKTASDTWENEAIPFQEKWVRLQRPRKAGERSSSTGVDTAVYEFVLLDPTGTLLGLDIHHIFASILHVTPTFVDRWGVDTDGVNDPGKWRVRVKSKGCPPAIDKKMCIHWASYTLWLHHTAFFPSAPCTRCARTSHTTAFCKTTEPECVSNILQLHGERLDLSDDGAALSTVPASDLPAWTRDAERRLAERSSMAGEDVPAPTFVRPEKPWTSEAVSLTSTERQREIQAYWEEYHRQARRQRYNEARDYLIARRVLDLIAFWQDMGRSQRWRRKTHRRRLPTPPPEAAWPITKVALAHKLTKVQFGWILPPATVVDDDSDDEEEPVDLELEHDGDAVMVDAPPPSSAPTAETKASEAEPAALVMERDGDAVMTADPDPAHSSVEPTTLSRVDLDAPPSGQPEPGAASEEIVASTATSFISSLLLSITDDIAARAPPTSSNEPSPTRLAGLPPATSIAEHRGDTPRFQLLPEEKASVKRERPPSFDDANPDTVVPLGAVPDQDISMDMKTASEHFLLKEAALLRASVRSNRKLLGLSKVAMDEAMWTPQKFVNLLNGTLSGTPGTGNCLPVSILEALANCSWAACDREATGVFGQALASLKAAAYHGFVADAAAETLRSFVPLVHASTRLHGTAEAAYLAYFERFRQSSCHHEAVLAEDTWGSSDAIRMMVKCLGLLVFVAQRHPGTGETAFLAYMPTALPHGDVTGGITP